MFDYWDDPVVHLLQLKAIYVWLSVCEPQFPPSYIGQFVRMCLYLTYFNLNLIRGVEMDGHVWQTMEEHICCEILRVFLCCLSFTSNKCTHGENTSSVTACIKRQEGFCCIQYQACKDQTFPFSLDIGSAIAANKGQVDTLCSYDYVNIPGVYVSVVFFLFFFYYVHLIIS